MNNLNNYKGKGWLEVSAADKERFLRKAIATSASDEIDVNGSYCMVDFKGLDISVDGEVFPGEYEDKIVINENGTFYDPADDSMDWL